MRPKYGRIYSYAIWGGFGGLVAWFLGMLFFRLLVPTQQQLTARGELMYVLVLAASFGCVVGGMMALIDSWWDDEWGPAIMNQPDLLLVGCFLGTVLAIFGHFVGFYLYRPLADNFGSVAGRVIGFGLGGLVGVIDGIHSKKRAVTGAIGGLVGGVMGGIIYYAAAVYIKWPLLANNTLAVAFPLWGICIMIMVSYANWATTSAWLTGVPGNHRKYSVGFSKLLDSSKPNVVGAGHKWCSFTIAMDNQVLEKHATIQFEKGRWYITPMDDAMVKVEGKPVYEKKQIFDSERIGFGGTFFDFNVK